MGHYARLSADPAGLAEHDTERLVPDAPVLNAPVSGHVWRNGRAIPFTLEAVPMAPRVHAVMPEYMIIAALVLVSFVAPIVHLFG